MAKKESTTPKPRKSRDGRATPRGVEPLESEPPAPRAVAFDPAAKAEEMRLWWVSGKDRAVEMPPADAPAGARAILLTRDDVKMRLRLAGVESRSRQTDEFLVYLQTHRSVNFCGELGGWKVGVYEQADGPVAILRSFRLVDPRAGEWPILRAFFASWFDDDGEPQSDYWHAWHKTAIAALRAGLRTRPGYLLALVGPSNCGKSFAQFNITRALLGGRDSNPLPWLLDRDNFNDDVARAEALIVSEMRGCKMDGASRAELGEAIKELLVNPTLRVRAQYSGAVMAESFRRVTFSLNDEVDRLKVFPPLTAGFDDKVCMLLCKKPVMPATVELDEWESLSSAIVRELPAYAHFLEHEWMMPERLMLGGDVGRFGFKNYIHPRLAADMFEQEPENLLLYFLDGTKSLWTEGAWGFLKAEQLHEEILSGEYGDRAKKAFGHSGAFLQHLGKLANKWPARFKKKHTRNGNLWLIDPPGK